MPGQSRFSIPSVSLASKHSRKSAFYNKKNMINKEMVTDILMVALLAIVPIVLVLVL